MIGPRQFDRLLSGVLDDLAAPGGQEYLDDVFARTRRTRQRPAWTSPGRWLPMQLTFPRVVVPRAVSLVALLALLLVATLIALAVVGSMRRPLPPPFGLAATGVTTFSAGGDIFVVRPDGSDVFPLFADADAGEYGATFSPDGTRVAFWRRDGEGTSLWVADAKGSEPRALVTDVAARSESWGSGLTWSPDSQRIAFSDGSDVLHVVGADGSGLRVLGGDELRRADPAWSPTGDLIAFKGLARGASVAGLGSIYVIPADGGADVLVAEEGGYPHWSPDGSRILTGMGAEPNGDVIVATRTDDGWSVEVLVGDTADDVYPRWSNDGTRIAFLRFAGVGRLYVANADGTDVHALSPDVDDVHFAQPCWTPDDTAILVLTGVLGRNIQGQAEAELVLIPSDGSAPRARIPAPGILSVDACSWQRLAIE